MSGLYLAVCPKCKQRRYDVIAQACERRQCGYVGPATCGKILIGGRCVRPAGHEADQCWVIEPKNP